MAWFKLPRRLSLELDMDSEPIAVSATRYKTARERGRRLFPLTFLRRPRYTASSSDKMVEGDFMGEPKARRAVLRFLGALMLATACGCAGSGVHFVSQTPGGGVITMPNNSDQWPTYYRSRAEQLIKQTCPNGYVIDREEVVVEDPARSGKQAPNDDEYYEYNGGLERLSRYRREEYHITFHCAPSDG